VFFQLVSLLPDGILDVTSSKPIVTSRFDFFVRIFNHELVLSRVSLWLCASVHDTICSDDHRFLETNLEFNISILVHEIFLEILHDPSAWLIWLVYE